MDVALREVLDYESTDDLKPEDAERIFDPRRPHAFMHVRIYNTGSSPMWIKNKDGVMNYAPPRPTIGISGASKGYVYVEVVHGSKHNDNREPNVVYRYRLNPKLLCKGCAVYLKCLGIYVSPDKRFLLDMVIPEDTQLMDRLRDLIHRSLHQMRQCPISVIISDPTRELDHVYAILDRVIYKIPILHTREYGKTCVVRFSGVDTADSDAIFDFNLDEMLDAFSQNKSFTPQIGQYKLMLFGSLEDAQEVLSKINTEEARVALGITAREKEAARLEFTSKIEHLERENAALRRQLEIYSAMVKIEDDQEKRSHSEKIQKLQVQKEESKVAKANVDYAAAGVGQTSAIVKAAAVIVPVLLGCIGLYATKLGVAGVMASGGLDMGISPSFGALGCIGAMFNPIPVVRKTFSAVKSVAGAVVGGIAKVGSWISSWF